MTSPQIFRSCYCTPLDSLRFYCGKLAKLSPELWCDKVAHFFIALCHMVRLQRFLVTYWRWLRPPSHFPSCLYVCTLLALSLCHISFLLIDLQTHCCMPHGKVARIAAFNRYHPQISFEATAQPPRSQYSSYLNRARSRLNIPSLSEGKLQKDNEFVFFP